ncbi:uncharacterized protein Tco025E_03889 [Trypanosoma conorhini]|uniref:CHAT domain-containing protein n=1 Tax=Trypanosoma conorhini TaxID=83891 RepID=A0A3R7NCT6_9TRYP|nr:uncharacterized protein Tco025E_03889 [Trypanosoma conorhini]RNF20188.1 hypothetical protein Tco025E_03889 [Trypanosoma conorhini]
MLNPGARPWYPSCDGAVGVQVPPVRRQNDPYQVGALQRPPTPLCGDTDLSAIQIDSLSSAVATAAPAAVAAPVSVAAVAAAPPRKGPYRSTMLLEQDVPALSGYCRQRPPWKSSGWMAGSTAPRPRSTTLSSLDSQGESREVTVALEESYCGAASRTPTPKVSIPLPRSQRQAKLRPDTPADAAAAWATATPPPRSGTNTDSNTTTATTPATCAANTTAMSATTTTSANATTATTDEEDIDNTDNTGVASNEGGDTYSETEGTTQSNSNEVTRLGIRAEGPKPAPASSLSGSLTAAKKPKPKTRRDEKWTIVQGKSGADSAAAAAAVSLKKSASCATAGKVRENGAVVRLPGRQPAELGRSKQQQREKEDEGSGKDEAIVEAKAKRPRDLRRTKVDSSDEELLERLVTGTAPAAVAVVAAAAAAVAAAARAATPSPNLSAPPAAVEGSLTPLTVMGVPIVGVAQSEELLPAPPVSARQSIAYRTFIRALTVSEASNVKMLLLQRALRQLPESSYHQCPALVCAILLETSDGCVDVEKSLQTCYKALQLAEKQQLELFEMLSRLAITRTFARVIDTMDARANLTRAATIAIAKNEKPALGWIAMQMGVTLEITGLFPESLAWYEAAERLARATAQPQLLCDIYCCQSIAFSAIGEIEQANQAYEASRALLPFIPRHRHQRSLQNYAQLKCQLGDMSAALHLQETELEIAREFGDTQAISRCLGAIALTKRFLCRYDEAAENYMEELSVYNAQDPRQTIESLTGAAVCWRLGGHLQKAYDYCMRALRQAQQCQDLTTLAKALVELAEAELSLDLSEKAQQHLQESLATIARVDEAEQKQYLVKAALCEVEWRCCSILEQVHFRKNEAFAALQCSDRSHVPNTVQVSRLLLRRQRRAGAQLETKDAELVSRSAVEGLLKSPAMQGWRIVCYSLPWNEGLDFMAYVLGLDDDGSLTCVALPLRLQEELIALLCTSTALSKVLDAPMYAEDGVRLYGDTPLWPQLYSKVAFDFCQSPTNAARVKSLDADATYCLKVLHDGFIAPLATHLGDAGGLMFVGDGVFSRLPFHAFYDGRQYLAERFCTSTCCSMALLCTHYADAAAAARAGEAREARRYTVVDAAAHTSALLDAYLAEAVEVGVCVRRVVIDEDREEPAAEARRVGDADGEETAVPSDDADVAATQRLLSALHRRGKVRGVRNALYRAVHEEAALGGVLELRLRALPEVREDYCGMFCASSSDVVASQSGEVANTWDLRPYALVVCTGVGTYAGLSIHETGVPVYRALQYAGACRMLMAVNSRLPTSDRVAAAAAAAAMAGGCSVAACVRGAYLQCIADGAPLAEWAAFSLVGLP